MSSTGPSRWIRRLVVTVIVLGVLAVAVDRVAEWAAENQLARLAADEAAKYDVETSDTSAEIGGFGFLPQLAKERFSSVTLTMKDPSFSGVAAEDLVVDLSDVHVPLAALKQEAGAAVTVDSTTIRLHLSPAELGELASRATGLKSLSLRIVDGELRAGLTLNGMTVDAAVSPVLRDGRIWLQVDEVSDKLPPIVREAVRSRQSGRGISVPELPFDASLHQITVEDGSLALVATVSDLTLHA